jgi:hypothetical protein
MNRARSYLPGFALRFCLVYGLLIVPWPPIERAYAGAHRLLANSVMLALPLDHHVSFRPVSATPLDPRFRLWIGGDGQEDADSYIVVRHKRRGTVRTQPFDTRRPGYLALAFLCALIVAMPGRWRERLRALALGTVLLHVYVAVQLGLSALLSYGEADVSWLPGAGATREVLIGLARNGAWYVAPVVIWAWLTFGYGYREVAGGAQASASPALHSSRK